MGLSEEIGEIREQIKSLEKRKRALFQLSLEAPEAEKACSDYIARALSRAEGAGGLFAKTDYPLEVQDISFEGSELWYDRGQGHQLVEVRPCTNPGAGKTFLGILIGNIALSVGTTFNPKTGVLNFGLRGHNPAIFVPDLQRVVYGCGSWWCRIETPDQIRAITDGDINSVWYVQALKAMEGPSDSEEFKSEATDSEVLQGVTEALEFRIKIEGDGLREDHSELLSRNLHLDEGLPERVYWHAGHVAGMLTALDWINRRITPGDKAMGSDSDGDPPQGCFP